MIKFFKEEKLEDLLKEDAGFFRMQRAIKAFVIKKLREMGFTEPQYKPYCICREFRGYDIDTMGFAFDIDKKNINIFINNALIDAYIASERGTFERFNLFVCMFHELNHILFSKLFRDNQIDNEQLYKEKMLVEHFKKKNASPFYSFNYGVNTEEALCSMNGVNDTIKFFKDNNIEISDEEMELLKKKYEEFESKLNNKQRYNPEDKQMYDLDELYDMIFGHNLKR